MIELKQAIRNAIEVELAAVRFYRRLAAIATTGATQNFLARMEAEEVKHVAALEKKANELVEGTLPASADRYIHHIETVPGWHAADNITLEEALRVALEAEQHAELYYDAMASSLGEGPVGDFLGGMARSEAQHVEALAGLIAQIQGTGERG
jgi:rubrerythrin